MSTEWSYRFRAPLRGDIADRDAFVQLAKAAGVYFSSAAIDTYDAARPVFGPGISRRTDFIDAAGVVVESGLLSLGISTQNLNRPAEDCQAGEGTQTRLSRLLDLLTQVTVTRPGQVVGCISNEHMDFHHAHPLVRVTNRIEVVRTPTDDFYFGYPDHYPDEVTFDGDLDMAFIRLVPGREDEYELDYRALYASLQLPATLQPA